jgi:hypothetical protein
MAYFPESMMMMMMMMIHAVIHQVLSVSLLHNMDAD